MQRGVQTDATCKARSKWMLHVVSVYTPCCMLLSVVGSSCAKFETGQTFSYVQTDATTPNIVGQQCCVRLHVALVVVK